MKQLLILSLFLAACAPAPKAETAQPGTVDCVDPRPQMCTRQYRPVCGERDTGVRCVTTPCPSTEWKTYGNACDACADAKVYRHRPGECEAKQE